MADRKSRYVSPRIASAASPPIFRLEQIAELLAHPAKITPAELRVKILAICEGRAEEPSDVNEWLDLAERAGVRHSQRYATLRKVAAELVAGRRVALAAASAPDGRVRTKKASLDQAEDPETALYRWWDAADLLLYIGISDVLSVADWVPIPKITLPVESWVAAVMEKFTWPLRGVPFTVLYVPVTVITFRSLGNDTWHPLRRPAAPAAPAAPEPSGHRSPSGRRCTGRSRG
jgi:hypothetical protein